MDGQGLGVGDRVYRGHGLVVREIPFLGESARSGAPTLLLGTGSWDVVVAAGAASCARADHNSEKKGTGLESPVFYWVQAMRRKTGQVGKIRGREREAKAGYSEPSARKGGAPEEGTREGHVGGDWIQGCKERGEWAELCFMARAAGLGLGVLKPLGDSLRFDVGVVSGGAIWRVQVKSTIYCRRGNEYSLNVMGPGRKQYEKGSVDFFAVWLIPAEEWYIIPHEAMGEKLTLHFTPGSKRAKWAQYREAWDLLTPVEIQACVDPLYEEEYGPNVG